jgi:DNA-binding MarR family transcriptional regulator
LTSTSVRSGMMHMHHLTRARTPTDAACACTALRKASRAITRMYDDALSDTGMSMGQFSILRNLSRQGELPLMQLADLLVMERTTLYRALTPLERQGWVLVAEGQGRAKTAVLTQQGRRALLAATGAWERAQRKILDAFGLKDWTTLEGSLARLVSAAQALET